MPVSDGRHRSIRAQISSLPVTHSPGSDGLPGFSQGIQETAIAWNSLWDALVRLKARQNRGTANGTSSHDDEFLGVSVEWPIERRLRLPETPRNLVIWVRKGDSRIDHDSSARILQIPPALIPAFATTPLEVRVYLHRPIPLSLAILQGLAEPSNGDANGRILEEPGINGFSSETNGNGQPNGQSSPHPSTVIRQDSIVNLPGSNDTRRYKTKIIVSTTPFIHTSTNNMENGDDASSASSSSHAPTHLSMADFDPDAFLSSSLGLSFNSASLADTADDELSQSISSSTSGSLTPRPGGSIASRSASPAVPVEELFEEAGPSGCRFNALRVARRPVDVEEEDVCWVGVSGLGRAGIFEGDWVLLRASVSSSGGSSSSVEHLVRMLAWEYLDDPSSDLPVNPLLLPPHIHRSLFSNPSTSTNEVHVRPAAFGARKPAAPIARTITIARVATSEGVDKRYERSWLRGLQRHFSRAEKGKGRAIEDGEGMTLVKRGDIFSVPVWVDRLVSSDDEDDISPEGEPSDSDSVRTAGLHYRQTTPTSVVYFIVTSLSYEPLVALEEDFRSSISSKARAGELGCWIDIGDQRSTKMVLTGVETAHIAGREIDMVWHGLAETPPPYSLSAASKLRNLLSSCFVSSSIVHFLQLSLLVKGARGSGKTSLVRSIADELGFSIVTVECYDIIGDTAALTAGTISAQVVKTKSCAPSLLLLKHVDVLAKKSESTATGKVPAIVKVLEDVLVELKVASGEAGWPCILVGTCADEDALLSEIGGVFKQDINLSAPNEAERLIVARNALRDISLAPDTSLQTIARQTAVLQPIDIQAFSLRTTDLALQRAMNTSSCSATSVQQAGLSLTAMDVNAALDDARSAYSDSIGAPKIPNVSWDDVGGLASVKKDILDTIQLPLERPELFGEGLKKRSGVLLYGPPGTGKTLLAKAVATTCSLNFFSVKGPELLNMYIGESEANVRRVFQRARDAAPCVIFMDELDSVAPKRGNQGDSAGVMDRIVSQLLAELDGMSDGKGGDVYVMGATNRPDLLDPALLRPGRFDRMLYLSVATTHQAQLSILQALTRKFRMEEELDLVDIAEQCPFDYTGADLYALCSDAMLRAMTRKAEAVDERIKELSDTIGPHDWPEPLTPQYYLESMARPEEIEVKVGREDFEEALARLVPSVSQGEMAHYEGVHREFQGYSISSNA